MLKGIKERKDSLILFIKNSLKNISVSKTSFGALIFTALSLVILTTVFSISLINKQTSIEINAEPNTALLETYKLDPNFLYCETLSNGEYKFYFTNKVVDNEGTDITVSDGYNIVDNTTLGGHVYLFLNGSIATNIYSDGIIILDGNLSFNGKALNTAINNNNAQRVHLIAGSNSGATLSGNLSNAFKGFGFLEFYDGKNIKNATSVTNMSNFFSQCGSMTKADISGLNTIYVTNMSYMFNYCSSLDDVNIQTLNTSACVDMNHMFYRCGCLKNINLINFDTSKVKDMSYMFSLCGSLTRADLSLLNISSVENNGFTGLFEDCRNLISVSLGKTANDKLISFNDVFKGCTNLQNVDLSHIDGSHIATATDTFTGCNKLITIKTPIHTNGVIPLPATFYDNGGNHYSSIVNTTNTSLSIASDPTLVGLLYEDSEGNKYCDDKYIDKNGVVHNTLNTDYKIFDCTNTAQSPAGSVKAYFYSDGTMVFDGCGNWLDPGYNPDSSKLYYSEIQNVTRVFGSIRGFKPIGNVTSLLYDAVNLNEAHFENFDTSGVTSFNGWFYGCSDKLYYLDLKPLDFSSNASLSRMFQYCTNLEEIEFSSHVNSAKCGDFGNMFVYCKNLKRVNSTTDGVINLNCLDVSSGRNFASMLQGCESVNTFVFDEWDTHSAVNFQNLFVNCNNLTSVDLSNFNTSNITTFDSMFNGCRKLSSVDVSHFIINPDCTIMSNMFKDCNSLTSLDLRKTSDGVNTYWDVHNVKKFNGMFNGCTHLDSLDISTFDATPTDVSEMFRQVGHDLTGRMTKFEIGTSMDYSNISRINSFYQDSKLPLGKYDFTMFASCGNKINNAQFAAYDAAGTVNFHGVDLSSLTQNNGETWVFSFDYYDEIILPSAVPSDSKKYIVIAWQQGYTWQGYDSNDQPLDYYVRDLKLVAENTVPNLYKLKKVVDIPLYIENQGTENEVIYYSDGYVVNGVRYNNSYTRWGICSSANLGNSINAYYYDKTQTLLLDGQGDVTMYSLDGSGNITAPWKYNKGSIKNVYASNFGFKPNGDISNYFMDLASLDNVDLSNMDTSNVTNMSNLFKGCLSIQDLDLSNFNTANVTDYSGMVDGSNALKYLNISNFEIKSGSNVTNMLNGEDLSKIVLPKEVSEDIILRDPYGKDTSYQGYDSLGYPVGSLLTKTGGNYLLPQRNDANHNGTMDSGELAIIKWDGYIYEAGEGNRYFRDKVIYDYDDITSEFNIYKVPMLSVASNQAAYTGDNVTMIDNYINNHPDALTAYFYIPKNAGSAHADMAAVVLHGSFVRKPFSSINVKLNQTICSDYANYIQEIKHAYFSNRGFKPANFTKVFEGAIKLTDVDLTDSNLDLSLFDGSMGNYDSYGKCDYAFHNASSLISVDLSKFINVTNVESMFTAATNLTTISNCDNLVTDKITSLKYIFRNCTNLSNINWSNWDVRNVTKFDYAFAGLKALDKIDLSGWNSKVSSCNAMFVSVSAPNGIDFGNLDFSSVKNIYCFYEYAILPVNDYTIFKDNNLTNIVFANYGTTTRTTSYDINLEGVELANANSTEQDGIHFFNESGSKNASTIILPNSVPTLEPITLKAKDGYVFKGYKKNAITGSLELIPGLTYTSLPAAGSDASGKLYAIKQELDPLHIENEGTSDEVIYYKNQGIKTSDSTVIPLVKKFDVTNTSGPNSTPAGTMMCYIYNDGTMILDGTGDINTTRNTPWGWGGSDTNNESYLIDDVIRVRGSINGFKPTGSMEGYFSTRTYEIVTDGKTIKDYNKMLDIDLTNIDTTNVTSFKALFYNCSKIETITGLSDLVTSSVTNMNGMFNCTNVRANGSTMVLDLSTHSKDGILRWDVSKVTDFGGMFGNAFSEEKHLDNWVLNPEVGDGSINFDGFTNGCHASKGFTVNNWSNTKKINPDNMFSYYYDRGTLDLSSFEISRDSTNMFGSGTWSCVANTIILPTNSFSGKLTLKTTDNKSKEWFTYNSKGQKVGNRPIEPYLISKLNSNGDEDYDDANDIYQIKFIDTYLYKGNTTLNGTTYTNVLYYKNGTSRSNSAVDPINLDTYDHDGNSETAEIPCVWDLSTDGSVKAYLYTDGTLILDGEGTLDNVPNNPNSSENYASKIYPWRQYLKLDKVLKVVGSNYKFIPHGSIESMFDYSVDYKTSYGQTGYYTSPSAFNIHSDLTSVDVTNFDTSHVTSMKNLFKNNQNVNEYDLTSLDVSNVLDFSGMLGGIRAKNNSDYAKMNVSGWTLNDENDINMSGLFGSSKLDPINMSGWTNTDHIANITNMFRYAFLRYGLDLSMMHFTNDNLAYHENVTDVFDHLSMVKYVYTLPSEIDDDVIINLYIVKDNSWYGYDNDEKPLGANCIFTTLPESEGTTSDKLNKIIFRKDVIYTDGHLEYSRDSVRNIYNLHATDNPILVKTYDLTNTAGTHHNSAETVRAYLYSNGMFILDGEGDVTSYTESTIPWIADGKNSTITKVVGSIYKFKPYGSMESYFNMGNVANSLLTTIDFTNIDTSNVTSFKNLMHSAKNLTTVTGISDLKTTNVQDMSSMFSYTENLGNLDLHYDSTKSDVWNVSNVLNFDKMFQGSARSVYNGKLNISNWVLKPSSNISFNNIFDYNNFSEIDLSGWSNTDSISSLDSAFTIFSAKELDLSTWDLTNGSLRNPYSFFYGGTSSLQTIKLPSDIKDGINITLPVKSHMSWFGYKADGTTKVSDVPITVIPKQDSVSGLYMLKRETDILYDKNGKTYYRDGTEGNFASLVKCYDITNTSGSRGDSANTVRAYLFSDGMFILDGEGDVTSYTESTIPWKVDGKDSTITKVVASNKGFTPYGSMESYFNMSDVDNSLFTSIDFTNIDTSNVTSFEYLFKNANNLTTLTNISELDTHNVTSMISMFDNCSKITNLDLSYDTSKPNVWNVSKVESFTSAFSNVGSDFSLDGANIDISNWILNSEDSVDFTSMFNGAKLTNLNLSNIDNTEGIFNINGLFAFTDFVDTSLDLSDLYLPYSTLGADLALAYANVCDIILPGEGNLNTELVLNLPQKDNCAWFGYDSSGSKIDDTMYTTLPMKNSTSGLYEIKLEAEILHKENGVEYYRGGTNDNSITLDTYDDDNDPLTDEIPCVWDLSDDGKVKAYLYTNGLLILDGAGTLKDFTETSRYGYDYRIVPWRKYHKLELLTKVVGSDYGFKPTGSLKSFFSMQFDSLGYYEDSLDDDDQQLTCVDFTHIDTSNVNSFKELFCDAEKLTTLTNIDKIDTSNVTNMMSAFEDVNLVSSLDLSGWDVSNVKTFSCMFYLFGDTYNYATLNLNRWTLNDSESIDCSYMFGDAQLGLLDISDWANTDSISNAKGMFDSIYYYDNTLDLSDFEFTNADLVDEENVEDMLYGYMLRSIMLPKSIGANINIYLPNIGEESWFGYKADGVTKISNNTYVTLPYNGQVTNLAMIKLEEDVIYYDSVNDVKYYRTGTDDYDITLDTYDNDNDPLTDEIPCVWDLSDDGKVKAYLYTDGLLILDGTGTLKDFMEVYDTTHNYKDVIVPWRKYHKLESLTKVVGSDYGFKPTGSMESFFKLSRDSVGYYTKAVPTDDPDESKNQKLTCIDFTHIDTSNVTSFKELFSFNYVLNSIPNISNIDTHNVTTMHSMFNGCEDLRNLDLHYDIAKPNVWNVSNVSNMYSMFGNLGKLVGSTKYDCTINLSGWTLNSAGVSLQNMFIGSYIKDLNISNWTNTDKIKDIREMFSFTRVRDDNLDISSLNLTNTDLVYNDNVLNIAISLSNSDFDTIILPIDIGTGVAIPLPSVDAKAWFGYDILGNRISMTYENLPKQEPGSNRTFEAGELYKIKLEDAVLHYENKAAANEIRYLNDGAYNKSGTKLYGLIDCYDISSSNDNSVLAYLYTDGMLIFDGEGAVKSYDDYTSDSNNVPYKEYLNTNETKITKVCASDFDFAPAGDMSNYLDGASSLVTFDSTHMNFTSVTKMNNFFRNNESLITCDLSNLTNSSVNEIDKMFMGCKQLASINLSNFTNSNVTKASHLFDGCENLTTLNLGTLTFSSVNDFSYMFNKVKVSSLDLANFNTGSATNMSHMFSNMTNITSLNLGSMTCPNFNTSSVTDFSYMFSNLGSSITSLDVSNFDTSKATNMEGMFGSDSSNTSLTSITFNPSSGTRLFVTNKVTNVKEMFKNLSGITMLDLSNFDLSKVTSDSNASDMFNGMTSLIEVLLPSDINNSITISLPALSDSDKVWRGYAGSDKLQYVTNKLVKIQTIDTKSMDRVKVYNDYMFELDNIKYYEQDLLYTWDISELNDGNIVAYYFKDPTLDDSKYGGNTIILRDLSDGVDDYAMTFGVLSRTLSLDIIFNDIFRYSTNNAYAPWSSLTDCEGYEVKNFKFFNEIKFKDLSFYFANLKELTSPLDITKVDDSYIKALTDFDEIEDAYYGAFYCSDGITVKFNTNSSVTRNIYPYYDSIWTDDISTHFTLDFTNTNLVRPNVSDEIYCSMIYDEDVTIYLPETIDSNFTRYEKAIMIDEYVTMFEIYNSSNELIGYTPYMISKSEWPEASYIKSNIDLRGWAIYEIMTDYIENDEDCYDFSYWLDLFMQIDYDDYRNYDPYVEFIDDDYFKTNVFNDYREIFKDDLNDEEGNNEALGYDVSERIIDVDKFLLDMIKYINVEMTNSKSTTHMNLTSGDFECDLTEDDSNTNDFYLVRKYANDYMKAMFEPVISDNSVYRTNDSVPETFVRYLDNIKIDINNLVNSALSSAYNLFETVSGVETNITDLGQDPASTDSNSFKFVAKRIGDLVFTVKPISLATDNFELMKSLLQDGESYNFNDITVHVDTLNIEDPLNPNNENSAFINVSAVSDKSYDGGNAITPYDEVILTYINNDGVEMTLEQGSDYTVTFTNNTNYGIATITIEGNGTTVTGTIIKHFNITQVIDLENHDLVEGITKVYDGNNNVLFDNTIATTVQYNKGTVSDDHLSITFTHSDYSAIPTGASITITGVYNDPNGKNAGAGKAVTLTYTLGGANTELLSITNEVINTTGDITPKEISVVSYNTDIRKTYDGNSNIVVTDITYDNATSVLTDDQSLVTLPTSISGKFYETTDYLIERVTASSSDTDLIPIKLNDSWFTNTGNTNYIIKESTLTALSGLIDKKKLTYEFDSSKLANDNTSGITITRFTKGFDNTNTLSVDATLDPANNEIVTKEGASNKDDVSLTPNPITVTYGGIAPGIYKTSETGAIGLVITPLSLTGTDSSNYYIDDISINEAVITAALIAREDISIDDDFTFTSHEIKPNELSRLHVIKHGSDNTTSDDDLVLIEGVDYEVTSYTNNINASSTSDNISKASLHIKGKGDYVGSPEFDIEFTIKQKPIEIDLTLSSYYDLLKDEKVYDGNTDLSVNSVTSSSKKVITLDGAGDELITMNLSGAYDNKNASNGFTKSLKFNFDFSDGAVSVKDSGSTDSSKYLSNYSFSFKDSNDTLTNAGNITSKELLYDLSTFDKPYDGNDTLVVHATIRDGQIISGDDVSIKDITITYGSILPGTYTEGDSNSDKALTVPDLELDGTSNGNYKITQPGNQVGHIIAKQIDASMVSAISNQTYTSKEIEPNGSDVEIKIDALTTLVKDTDYTLSYSNNINVGVAIITITPIGEYSSSSPFNVTFNIDKKDISVNLNDNTTFTGDITDTKVYDKNTNLSNNNADKVITVNGCENEVITINLSGYYDNVTASNAYTKGIYYKPLANSLVTGNTVSDGSINNYNIIYTGLITDDSDPNKDYILANNSGNITSKSLSDSDVVYPATLTPNSSYTGSPITRDSDIVITYKDCNNNDVTLSLADGDYSLTYTNNTEPGVATITISGDGTNVLDPVSPASKLSSTFIIERSEDLSSVTFFNDNELTKVYDGTNIVYFNNAGVLETSKSFTHDDISAIPEHLIITFQGTYDASSSDPAGKDRGDNKDITLTYTLSVDDSVNYNVANFIISGVQDKVKGTITPKIIDVTSYNDNNSDIRKVYDKTRDITFSITTDDSKVLADDITLVTLPSSLHGMYDNANASSDDTDIRNITLDTNWYVLDNTNYELDQNDLVNLTGHIDPKSIVDASKLDITYIDNGNAGDGDISITTKAYTGTNVTIDNTDISNIALRDIRTNNGAAIYELINDNDYELSYDNNISAGDHTASVTFTAKGNYTDSITLYFSISPNAISDSANTITYTDKIIYPGKGNNANDPLSSEYPGRYLTIVDGSKSPAYTLAEGTDYDLIFIPGAGTDGSDNFTDCGTFKVEVRGKGNYSGSSILDYEIIPYDIYLSDINLDSDNSNLVIYKDGTNNKGDGLSPNDISHFALDSIKLNYTYNPKNKLDPSDYEVVTFNYRDAIMIDKRGSDTDPYDYTFIPCLDNDIEKAKAENKHDIKLDGVRINGDSINKFNRNFRLLDDITNKQVITNAHDTPRFYDDISYLLDNTNPVINSLTITGGSKIFGIGQTIEFVMTLSEEMKDIDSSLFDNLIINVETSSGANNFDVPLKSISTTNGSGNSRSEGNHITTYVFNKVLSPGDIADNSITNISNVTFTYGSTVPEDNAGNPISVDLSPFDFSDYTFDTTGYAINITNDITSDGSSDLSVDTQNYIVTYNIKFNNCTLKDTYSMNDILSKFKFMVYSYDDVSGNFKDIPDKTLDLISSTNPAGLFTLSEITPREEYEVRVDTRTLGLIGKDDINGKIIKLHIDKEQLQDIYNRDNIECSNSVKVVRTIDANDITFKLGDITSGETLIWRDDNYLYYDIGSGIKVYYYKDDILTVIANKLIDGFSTFIHFEDGIGNIYDSGDVIPPDTPTNYASYTVGTINDILSRIFNYVTDWARPKDMLEVKIELRTIDAIIDIINDGVSNDDYLVIKNGVFDNVKDITLIDDDDLYNQSGIATPKFGDIIPVGNNKLHPLLDGKQLISYEDLINNYSNTEIVSKELLRRAKEEDLVITKDNLKDTLVSIIKDINDKDNLLYDLDPVNMIYDITDTDINSNPNYASDIEEAIIRYNRLKLWVRNLPEVTNNEYIIKLLDNYYGNDSDKDNIIKGLIDGYNLSNINGDNDLVEVFGAVNKLDAKPSDSKINLVSSKLTDKASLDKINKEFEDDLSLGLTKKILVPLNINLVDSKNANTKYDPGISDSVLVKLKLPTYYYDDIDIVKTTYTDSKKDTVSTITLLTSDSDKGNVLKTMYGDTFYLYFDADDLTNAAFTLVSNKLGVITSYDGDYLKGGSITPSGIIPFSDILDGIINVTVKTDYRADIYKNNKLDSSLDSSRVYKIKELSDIDKSDPDNIDLSSLNENIYIRVLYKYDPKDDKDKKDLSTFTITIQVANHTPYVNGYKDKTFRPNENMTRAEFAKVIATLSVNYPLSNRDENLKYNNKYNDVNKDKWYAPYVGYVTKCNLMKGYGNGTFKPEQMITRAEACKVLSEMFLIKNNNVANTFTKELAGHWYESSVNKLVRAGYIKGYPNGKFMANGKITRAEIVALINRVKERNVNPNKQVDNTLKSRLKGILKDVEDNRWYYNDVIEATVPHSTYDLH